MGFDWSGYCLITTFANFIQNRLRPTTTQQLIMYVDHISLGTILTVF